MDKGKKTILTVLWGLAVLGMLGVVGTGVLAHRRFVGTEDAMPILFDAPKFSLTDQFDKPVTDQTLRGKVWVTMVFFASCPGVCPMMSARMAQLQKAVESPELKIVSLTVDPDNDTPEMLKGYAEGLGADQSRWYFLRGPKDTMFEVARGFNLAAAPAQDGKPITHTQKVLLIDRENHVRGIYDTTDEESMKKLTLDARMLAEQ